MRENRKPEWSNGTPEAKRRGRKRYRAAHPEVMREARRRAKAKVGRCSCCTVKEILAVYRRAIETGCEVDHIVPFSQGGTHCVKNLQVLTKAEHVVKTAAERTGTKYRKREFDAYDEVPC